MKSSFSSSTASSILIIILSSLLQLASNGFYSTLNVASAAAQYSIAHRPWNLFFSPSISAAVSSSIIAKATSLIEHFPSSSSSSSSDDDSYSYMIIDVPFLRAGVTE
jgi:hypothetical protein